MMRAHETMQAGFAAALRDPDAPVPEGLTTSRDPSLPRRFAVYRNNVAVALIEALAIRFPVTQQVVGDEFFRAMARVFTKEHLPRSPVLMHYGDELPDFIAAFPPAAGVAFLADLARLEALRTDAYHAADAAPFGPEDLAAVAPADLADLTLRLHPAARLLSSNHPVATLWQRHQTPEADLSFDSWEGEDVLVTRPDLDVEMRLLPPGMAAFLQAMVSGDRLGAAAEAMEDETFDLSLTLRIALEAGVFTKPVADLVDESKCGGIS